MQWALCWYFHVRPLQRMAMVLPQWFLKPHALLGPEAFGSVAAEHWLEVATELRW